MAEERMGKELDISNGYRRVFTCGEQSAVSEWTVPYCMLVLVGILF